MWHTHAQGQRAIVHVAPGVQDEQSATSSFRAGRGHNRTRGGKQHHTSSAEGTTLEHVQHPCHPRQFTSNRTGFAAVPRVIVPRRREEQGRNRADEVLCMLPEKGGGWRAWLKGVMGTETRVPSWMSRGHCHTRRGGRGHAHHTGKEACASPSSPETRPRSFASRFMYPKLYVRKSSKQARPWGERLKDCVTRTQP